MSNPVLVVFTVLCYLQAAECISCLQCLDIADPGQCETIVQCTDNQTCYIESVMSLTSYRLQYSMGCSEMKLCKFMECTKAAYGTLDTNNRRATGISICSECCYDNNCNIEGCGYKYKATNIKCYECTNVYEGGPLCTNTVSCDLTTDTCSVTVHRHSIQRNVFDLGCTNKRQCELLLSLPGELNDPNSKCCGKFLCNGDPHFNPPNQTSSVRAYSCPPDIATRATPPMTTTTPYTTTPAPTTTTPPTTTSQSAKPASCETCLSGNCTNPRTMTCGNGEQYCMNTVKSDGVTTTVKKACATEMECYYDSYIGMKNKPECAGASRNAGNQPYVCHYCCDAKSGYLSACNTDIIPQQPAVFDQSGSHGGTVCEVGRNEYLQETICNGPTPFCMNTVILQTNHRMIEKTCESEITCKVDWWEQTRNIKMCMQTNSSMLPVLDEGLKCYYCCKSDDGQPCNTDLIPSDAQNVIAKSVDGGWSEWTAWAGCSQYCTGIQDRYRGCDNPVPGVYGTNCQGQANEQENCDSSTNCQISATGSQTLIGR